MRFFLPGFSLLDCADFKCLKAFTASLKRREGLGNLIDLGLRISIDRCVQKGQSELSAVEKFPVVALMQLFTKVFSRYDLSNRPWKGNSCAAVYASGRESCLHSIPSIPHLATSPGNYFHLSPTVCVSHLFPSQTSLGSDRMPSGTPITCKLNDHQYSFSSPP